MVNITYSEFCIFISVIFTTLDCSWFRTKYCDLTPRVASEVLEKLEISLDFSTKILFKLNIGILYEYFHNMLRTILQPSSHNTLSLGTCILRVDNIYNDLLFSSEPIDRARIRQRGWRRHRRQLALFLRLGKKKFANETCAVTVTENGHHLLSCNQTKG